MPNTFEVPKIPGRGIYNYRGRIGDWAFALEGRSFLPDHLPPYSNIGELIAPFVVNPDSELHLARKQNLVPLSKPEQIFSGKELYDRIDRLYSKLERTGNTHHRPERVYELLIKAKECYSHSQELLKPLLRYYDELGLRKPIELVREDPEATASILEVLAAEEAQLLGWPKESEDEQSQRKSEIQSILNGQDDEGFQAIADRVVRELGDRSLFWMDELATVVLHPALRELDNAVGSDINNA